MQEEKRAITNEVMNDIRPLNSPAHDAAHDAWVLEPDDLRNQVQKALSTLCEEDHKVMLDRLLTGLARAGVPVGTSLFMIGIRVGGLDDLTPSDMGKLLRYIRINTPMAIGALNGLLTELLVGKEELLPIALRIDIAA
jgi:hypothetical protein